MSEQAAEQVFREAAEAVAVSAPPTDAVAAEARAHRRRRLAQVAAGGAALAVVVAAGTWAGTRPDGPPEPESAPVRPAENPADLAWWANNELHLEHVVVRLRRPTHLAVVTGGAVYGADDGEVHLLAEDGQRTVLGRKQPRAPLVVSDEQGWAVWVEPGNGASELVVYDLTGRDVLARTPVPEGTEPIAVHLDTIYYRTPGGDLAWSPPYGAPESLDRDGMLDIAGGTRVLELGMGAIEMVQPFFNVSFVRPGRGAELSPDGDFVLTRTEDPGSAYGAVRVYDTRSGDEVSSGLSEADLAVAARLGESRTISYVVARAEDRPRAEDFLRLSTLGPLELRTCDLDTGECVRHATFPSTGSAPVLAR